jgi:enoyl-CoA hydratase/carnithine racemase
MLQRMDYETLTTDLEAGIFTVTLNRPDRLNAFTSTMLSELLDAVDEIDRNDDVRVAIFTGAGRGYCAGADLSGGSGTFDHAAREAAAEHRDGGGLLTLRLYDCAKPVIAAINGPAVGVGVTMSLPMDVRIASERAKFGFVFARRGIVPEACSSWFLPRVVGIAQAMEWVATGRVFSADEALAGGLVSRVVPHDELLPTARGLALEIAENTSAVSVAFSRQLMWKMLGADHPMAAHRLDSRAIYAMGHSPDGHEGVASFLEKRPAAFPMKVSSDMPDPYPWWEPRPFSD